MIRTALAAMALLVPLSWPGLATAAGNCEEIRARIDAKIRASGAQGYRLTVVDSGDKVTGKVVGRCDLGRRQIVYLARSEAPAAQEEPLLTECKDGTVQRGGDCPR